MSDSLMTEPTQTNEGSTQQPVDASTEATTETQQQAETVADQQDSDESAVESETSESEQETTQEGAPESYEFNRQVADAPDELDPEVVNAFGDVAKELNLPQDAAQKVLDKVAPVLQRRQAEAVEEAKTEWANEAKADQEFGGETLDANLTVAKSALDAFGTDALKSLLSESGLGNHPEVIRFMYRAGKAISEDSYVGNSLGANAKGGIPKDFNGIANALYSNQQNK